MYGAEPPQKLKIRDLQLLQQCPAANGVRSAMPTSQLDRWTAVADAVGEWYRQTRGEEDIADIEERNMSFLDPVQHQITRRLFVTYRQVMAKKEGDSVDSESWYATVWDTGQNATLGAATQWTITTDTGVEYIKLKTGRSSTSDAEVAVMIEGAEEESPGLIEVNAAAGTVETLDLAEEEVSALVAELFAVAATSPKKRGTVPGLHCYVCPRPARCGQYPALEPRLVGAESRAVLVSKKWLASLGRCERQTAWARLYGIPTDEGEEDDGTAAEVGISFHNAAAAALVSEDPDETFAASVSAAPGSEQSQLLQLWENLKTLAGSEPHPVTTIRDTEYGIGCTAHSPGPYIDSRGQEHPDKLVAVVMAGFADAVGREADGTPAVVEFRTGGGAALPLEPELYALGAHLLSGKTPVAVHTHKIGNPEELTCDRLLFDESRLEAARETLTAAAGRIAKWHPTNSLSAPYTVGEWCTWCEFSNRCVEFRT
jgi:hypothetical protein